MNLKLLTISQASEMIGVSIQTLRRWDESRKLSPIRETKTGHRYYRKSDIESYIKNNLEDLFNLAKNWTLGSSISDLPSAFYCPDVSVFQARLTKLENNLSKINKISKIFPLISAIVGEMGNNSFDHNLGNWPDIPGIFFSYDLKKGEIVLADRGQGILTTLKQAKPTLESHQEALYSAFTEVISGRAPEYRGNGLKFVKNVVVNNEIKLFFQTGDAELEIQKDSSSIKTQKSITNIQGCLVLIKF